MLDGAMKKSMEAYLRPGEELRHVAIVQAKGMTGALAAGGAIGQAVKGSRHDKKSGEQESGTALRTAPKMGIAITSDRLLIAKAGGAFTLKAQELITDVPIADIDSLEVGKGKMSKPVTITARGESIQVEAPKASNTDKLVSAFQQAKSGSPAAA